MRVRGTVERVKERTRALSVACDPLARYLIYIEVPAPAKLLGVLRVK
jgi:hypothetical protein